MFIRQLVIGALEMLMMLLLLLLLLMMMMMMIRINTAARERIRRRNTGFCLDREIYCFSSF